MQSNIINYKKEVLNRSRETQASSTGEINLIALRSKGLDRIGIAIALPRLAKKRTQTVTQTSRRITSTSKSSSVRGNTPTSGEEAWFIKYVFTLEKLRELPENWDSYGAEPPNFTALYWSKTVLELLLRMNLPPSRVTPSVENGVGISFIRGQKYADIECFNTGEILAVISDRRGKPYVWEVGDNIEAIKLALEKICVFIRG